MNVLIVTPHMNALFKRADIEDAAEYPYNYTFPIGPAYISSALKNASVNTFCIDLNLYKNPMEALEKKIKENDIDIIGIGGLSREYWRIKHLVKYIKENFPHIITCLGGGIISSEPELIFGDLGVDYGVLGEGDVTVVELIKSIEAGKDVNNVKGIVFQKNNEICITESREVIPNLDLLPSVDYDGFEVSKYLDLQKCLDFWYITDDNPRALPIVASRSCPYNCSFCFHTIPKYRQISLERLFKDIDYLIPKYNINFLFIYDDLFASVKNNDRLVEYCRRIKKYNIKWYCQLRVDSKIDTDVVAEMKESGCEAIGLGVEHVNEEVLKSMNKNISLEQVERSLSLVYNAKIGIAPNILIGDVRETKDTINSCYEWYQKNRKYQLSVVEVIPYPGTTLYKKAIERGLITDRLEFIRSGCPGINFTDIENQEYSNIVRNFREQFYDIAENISMKTGYDEDRGDLYTIVFKCTHCGEMNVLSNVSKILVNEVGCKSCKQRNYRFRNEDYYFYLSLPKLKTLIDRNPETKIALCGPSKVIMALVNNLDGNYKRNVVKVIDINPKRQGVTLGEYTIEKLPDDISELQNVVDVIFIAAQFSYTEIYHTVAKAKLYGIDIV